MVAGKYIASLLILVLWAFPLLSSAQQREASIDRHDSADATYRHLKTALFRARKLQEPMLLASSHRMMGDFLCGIGGYSEAIQHFNKARQLLENRPPDSLIVLLHQSIGKLYLAQDNYLFARDYFEEGLSTAEKIGYIRGIAACRGLLGHCLEKTGQYLKALDYQKESLRYFQQIRDRNGIAEINENIGSIYEDISEFEMAHYYFSKAYEEVSGLGNSREVNLLNNLGDVHRKTGAYEEALKTTGKALELARALNDHHQMESAYKDLSKTYALMGSFKQAHENLIAAEKIQETWLTAQYSHQLLVLQTIYETDKKEAEIDLLREQNKVSKVRQNLYILGFLSGLVLLGLLQFFIRRKRKADWKMQQYRQRTLKAELARKELEEKNMQQEIRLKTAALSRYSLHVSEKNKILADLSTYLKNLRSRDAMNIRGKIVSLVSDIDSNLQREHEWEDFTDHFKDIHPDFIKRLSAVALEPLSPAELRLGMLLRMNMPTKEIAALLRVTPDSVRVARYRLRKKLPLRQKEELVNFMMEL